MPRPGGLRRVALLLLLAVTLCFGSSTNEDALRQELTRGYSVQGLEFYYLFFIYFLDPLMPARVWRMGEQGSWAGWRPRTDCRG
jgi:hypothetical protein